MALITSRDGGNSVRKLLYTLYWLYHVYLAWHISVQRLEFGALFNSASILLVHSRQVHDKIHSDSFGACDIYDRKSWNVFHVYLGYMFVKYGKNYT